MFCTYLIVFIKSSAGFWPFSDTLASPTIEFYPKPPDADRGSSLIYYTFNNRESSQGHIDSINGFLKNYNDPAHVENSVYCDFDFTQSPTQFCVFRPSQLGPCSAERDFGFLMRRPCIFLTLSKVSYFPGETPGGRRWLLINQCKSRVSRLF